MKQYLLISFLLLAGMLAVQAVAQTPSSAQSQPAATPSTSTDTATGKAPLIPSAFIGKWIETADRDQQLVVTSDSISWKRKDEGTETFPAEKVKLIDNGQTIAFDATETAYWNYATGEKPRRPIQVTIKSQAGQLRVMISGGETTAPGPSQDLGVHITTPPKEYWFKHK